MREVLLAVVLLSAGLAGCIGDDAEIETANATDAADTNTATDASVPTFPNGTPAPETLAFPDCVEQAASFPVPASAYQDELPEGFATVPYSAGGTIEGEPAGQTAELIVLGYECEGSDEGASAALAYLLVDPPEAWENPDASFGHAILLDLVTPSEQTASVYEAWGMGPAVSTGEVSLEATETPAVRLGTTTASSDGSTMELQTSVEAPPSELEAAEVRWFAVDEEAEVTGAMDVNWTALQITLGEATLTGSGFGTLETVPAQEGIGLHNWDFDQWASYVDLLPKEGS